MTTLPPVGSKAPYIIICQGRTEVLDENTASKKICAASRCASELVQHMALVHKNKLTFEDTKPISDLQHEMMDDLKKYTKREATEKCEEMFTLLYALEDKFQDVHNY